MFFRNVWQDLPIDPTDDVPVEPLVEEMGDSEALKKMTNTALAFFTGGGS